jgi:DNA-directed RNA polymerase subunit RPC12/RpoP
MIKIDANGIRDEIAEGFFITCQRCGSKDVEIKIDGAEEHGEVGYVNVLCKACGHWVIAQTPG